jgi:phasin family protein
MVKNFEDMQAFGKESFEATVASMTALTKGMQAAANEVVEFSRKAVEQTMQTTEKVMGAKSVDKAIELQQAYSKAAYEAYVAQINKLGEIYIAAAKEAYKPFEARIAQLTQKPGQK